MNTAQLLSCFDRISEASDAIPRLRRFILDLAVRGKLVEQDPRDEPASELLKRIQAEKERLVKTGEIRRQEPARPIDEQEVPFEIPPGWCLVRLIDVLTKLTDGTHHSPTNLADGDFKYITAKNIKPEGVSLADVSYVTAKVHHEIYARCNPEKGDILYIKDGATTGIVAINDLDEPFSMLSSVALLKLSLHVYNRLIVEFLRSPFFYMQMRGLMKGAAITRVTLKRMAPALIPLPPLAEQHRIVAKVDELMALCDRLEVAQAERESRRDRLVSSSLNRLNNGADLDAFPKYARFYLNHLPRLTTSLEHIQQLRQTILNLAVRGKLVPQDPNDEPASELLKRIQEEKARLVNAGILTQQKLTTSAPKELAFDCPMNWVAVDFNDGCNLVTSGSRGWAEFYSDSGPKFIRAQNIRFGRLRLDDLACVRLPKKAEGTRTQVSKGDLLIVITGAGVTNPALLDRELGEAYVSQHVALIKPITRSLSRWLLICLMAPAGVRSELVERAYGAGKPGLNLDNIRSLRIALPPLAEQHRIVAKVEELMALCDRLEAQLTTTQTESRRLLEAVLHEAMTPTLKEAG
ncbi:MAG: restriction endonuclease subunit S [Nitrospira sp.]|nr:restriction endonuclease subunit S [Nitrospira sp.]